MNQIRQSIFLLSLLQKHQSSYTKIVDENKQCDDTKHWIQKTTNEIGIEQKYVEFWNHFTQFNKDILKKLTFFFYSTGSIGGASSVEQIGPLSNVCFAVFALGSSAYPKFCNFGKTVDKILGDLGGERLLEVACGDEMYGQEQQFRSWSSNIFQASYL